MRTVKPRDLGLSIDKGYEPKPAELANANRDMIQITDEGDRARFGDGD